MEMMVYQYFSCRGCKNSVTHGIYTMDSIKVQTANDIRLGNQLVSELLVAVVQKDVLAPGHPFQEVGKGVRHNNIRRLSLRAEEVPQAQRRADGVPVGTHMRNDYYLVCTVKPFGEMVYLGLFYYFGQHIFIYYLTIDYLLFGVYNKLKGQKYEKFVIYNNMR